MGATPPALPALVQRLRSLTPDWPVSPREARWIAEQQASLLIAESGIIAPPIPMSIVSDLDGLDVYLLSDMPVQGLLGASKPNLSGGVILLDCNLPLTEQRVTLLHELKHVIDGGHQTKLRTAKSQRGGEGLCTAFAMNVLMPPDWLRRDWLDGIRSLSALAERYQVPIEGMKHRLHGLGFLERASERPGRPLCQWQAHSKNDARGNSS